jgi:hypothetical protein
MPFEIGAPVQADPEKRVDTDASSVDKVRIVYAKPPITEKRKLHMDKMNAARRAGASKTKLDKLRLIELEKENQTLRGAGSGPVQELTKPTVQASQPVDWSLEIDRKLSALLAKQKPEPFDYSSEIQRRVDEAMMQAQTVRANHRIEKPPKPKPKRLEEPEPPAPDVVRSRLDKPRPSRIIG